MTLFGLYLGAGHHGSWPAFVIGLVSAVSVFIFISVAFNKILATASAAGLLMASVLNVLLRQRT